MPENPEIVQPLTLLKEVADRESERLTDIRRALAHPKFYDGDIGADIRWLLSGYELLRQHAKSHQRDYSSLAKKLDDTQREQLQDRRVVRTLEQELIGANEMKAKFEQSAAEGWANYRELKADTKSRLAQTVLERDEARAQFDKHVEWAADHCSCVHDGRGSLTNECQEHAVIREQRDCLLAALKAIAETGDDCPACDRGVLRHPENGHWPTCPFGHAQVVIAASEGR